MYGFCNCIAGMNRGNKAWGRRKILFPDPNLCIFAAPMRKPAYPCRVSAWRGYTWRLTDDPGSARRERSRYSLPVGRARNDVLSVFLRRPLKKDHRLHARDLEALAAARILALHEIVAPQHVGTRLGKARAVALIRLPAQRLLFGAHQPADLVGLRLMAKQSIKIGRLQALVFVE